jgi:hypothetical protein
MEDLRDRDGLDPTTVTIIEWRGLPSAVLRVMSEQTRTKFGINNLLIMSKPPLLTVQPVLTVTDLATGSCFSAGLPRSVYLSCNISKAGPCQAWTRRPASAPSARSYCRTEDLQHSLKKYYVGNDAKT